MKTALLLLSLLLLSACATAPAPVLVGEGRPNPVSRWDEIATATINQPAAPSGTPAEQRPFYPADLATLHLAMHDALAAVRGQPGLMKSSPRGPAPQAALPEAAVASAAYRVLRGLFPARGAQYEAAYAEQLASWPAGPAREQGIALGEAAAARALALRADDGRMVRLEAFVPGTGPGEFRGVNPIGRNLPSLKPFLGRSLQSYRAPGPPPLQSSRYAADFNEVKRLAAASSAERSEAQLEQARFHLEPPHLGWPRNLRRFARHGDDLLQSARVMALLYVVHSDAYAACFESKYHHRFWRPATAIHEADRDGNPATEADPAWKPALPVPNHPEYPSGHACLFAATGAMLEQHFGTQQVSVSFDSGTSKTLRRFADLQELGNESDLPRIVGGMHFRFAIEDGKRLGRAVATALRQQLASDGGL